MDLVHVTLADWGGISRPGKQNRDYWFDDWKNQSYKRLGRIASTLIPEVNHSSSPFTC